MSYIESYSFYSRLHSTTISQVLFPIPLPCESPSISITKSTPAHLKRCMRKLALYSKRNKSHHNRLIQIHILLCADWMCLSVNNWNVIKSRDEIFLLHFARGDVKQLNFKIWNLECVFKFNTWLDGQTDTVYLIWSYMCCWRSVGSHPQQTVKIHKSLIIIYSTVLCKKLPGARNVDW